MAEYKTPTSFFGIMCLQFHSFILITLTDLIFKASEVLAMHKLRIYKNYACTSLYLL